MEGKRTILPGNEHITSFRGSSRGAAVRCSGFCVGWVSRAWGKIIYEAVGAREAELTGLQEEASVRDGREKDVSARKRALDQW